MTYDFKVNGDKITLNGATSANSGSVNFYECKFDFSKDWENLQCFAVFIKDDKTYTAIINNGFCPVPYEVLESPSVVSIGVYGSSLDSENLVRISTDFSHIVIKEGAYRDGTAPQVPKAELWEEFYKGAREDAKNSISALADTVKSEIVTTTSAVIDASLGDIDKALDIIIEIQNSLLGGDTK